MKESKEARVWLKIEDKQSMGDNNHCLFYPKRIRVIPQQVLGPVYV